jgi:methionyl-tRNA synthetase
MNIGWRVPATGAWTLGHREFYRQLCGYSQAADSLLLVETFSSRAYLQIVDGLIASARTFRAAETARRELAHRQEEARTSVALEYLAAKAFAALVYPVMPDLGQSLWHAMGLRGDPQRESNWTFLPPGTAVVMPDVPRAG